MSKTDQRLVELSKELDFLDLCKLVLLYQAKSTINIDWKHPTGARVKVNVNPPRRRRASTAAASEPEPG